MNCPGLALTQGPCQVFQGGDRFQTCVGPEGWGGVLVSLLQEACLSVPQQEGGAAQPCWVSLAT